MAASEQIVIEYIANVEGLKAQLKTVQTELKAVQKTSDDTASEITSSFNKTEVAAKSLKTQLRELKAQLAVATDPKDVERLAKAAGEIENKLQDASAAARIFSSDSKFEQIRTALGGIGRNIASLNFKQAAVESQLLVSAVKSLTFKEALSGIKDLGSTLLNLGKAVLLNPIFLLAATITGIGVALVALKDKIPFVTKAFDFIAESITKIKNAVTNFTDSIGLTTVATDKAFDRLIAKGKEVDEQRARRVAFLEEEKKKNEEAAKKQEKDLQDERDFRAKILDERAKGYAYVNKLREDDLKAEKEKLEKEEKLINDSMMSQFESNQKIIKEGQEKTKEDAIKNTKEQEDAIAEAKQQNIDTIKFAFNELVQYQNDLDDDRLRQIQKNLDAGIISQTQFDEQSAELRRKQAIRDKAVSAFNIVIATAEAVIKALAVPPPGGEILAGARAAFGAVQLALVLAKPIPQFAEGTERVTGGQKGVDSVHAMLMPDEAVIKAKENMAYPGLSKAWNSGHLDEFIMENFITPKLSEALGGSTAENMAKSIKINGLDEYGIGRALRRNSGVSIQNSDYLAKSIARELKRGRSVIHWA